jgi:hypothetical protein
MRSPREAPTSVRRKEFAAYTPGEARTAASQWLRNFRDHPPLDIRGIRISEERDLFVATVTYTEMTVEETPQYFPNYQPQFKKAS